MRWQLVYLDRLAVVSVYFVWQYCAHFTVNSGNRQRALAEIYGIENGEPFVFFEREVL